MSQKPCGELLPTAQLIEIFEATDEAICGIEAIFANYGKTLSSSVSMSLIHVDFPMSDDLDPSIIKRSLQERAPIAAKTWKNLPDNTELTLLFELGSVTSGETYAIKIWSPDANAETSGTIWLHEGDLRIRGHKKCLFNDVDQGQFGLRARIALSDEWSSSGVPQSLLYSPITQCNLNCIHCISRDTRDKKSILCKSIKNEIRRWARSGDIKSIATDYSGDILWADEKFGGELDFIFDLDIPFHIDTNGVYLNRGKIERLLKQKITSINISLDASRNSTFRSIRKGAPDLKKIIDNIRDFIQLRKSAGLERIVHVSLGFTLMDRNLDEWLDFIEMAADLGVDEVICRHLEAYTKDMERESLVFQKDKLNKVRQDAVKRAEQLGIRMAAEKEIRHVNDENGHVICEIPWQSAVITGNGDVSVCCVPKTQVGNLNLTSMEKLWNGSQYREFRRRVNSKAPPDQCLGCGMRRSPSNINSYLPSRSIANWKAPHTWR